MICFHSKNCEDCKFGTNNTQTSELHSQNCWKRNELNREKLPKKCSILFPWNPKMSEIKKFWALYNTVGGGEGKKCMYPTRLDTYWQGCSHDCSYCYAKSLLEFRGLWNPANPKFIDLREAYRIIAREIPKEQITRLWGMTDCFQPVEKIHKITYNVLKAFKKVRKWYLIVTKSDLVASDEYIEVLDKDLAHIQITITTTNDELASTYEKATRPSDRIKAIEKLQKLWFDVQIRLSPYIPPYVDIEKINAIKCDKIIVEFLRVNHRIKKRFPIDYTDYTHSEWGYQHLPLEKKKELISKIHKKEISVCEDVYGHYLYWKENFNHNPDDCCNLRKSISK